MDEFLRTHKLSEGALELLVRMDGGETFPYTRDLRTVARQELVDGRYVEAKEVGLLFFKKEVYQINTRGQGLVGEYRKLQKEGKA